MNNERAQYGFKHNILLVFVMPLVLLMPWILVVLGTIIDIRTTSSKISALELDGTPIKITREIGTKGEIYNLEGYGRFRRELIKRGFGNNLITIDSSLFPNKIIDVKYDKLQCEVDILTPDVLNRNIFQLSLKPKVVIGEKILLTFLTEEGRELPLELLATDQGVQEINFNGLKEWYPSLYETVFEPNRGSAMVDQGRELMFLTIKYSFWGLGFFIATCLIIALIDPYLWLIKKISHK